MNIRSRSCGLTIEVEATSSWSGLVERALGGPVAMTRGEQQDLPGCRPSDERGQPDICVTVESTSAAFTLNGLHPVTRGAYGNGHRMVLFDACGSGLDLLIEPSPDVLHVIARHRPGARHRALHLAAPARTELLRRAALLQYPSLWWAGVRNDAVPLHVSAARIGREGVVVAGPGGVGKSTLLHGLARDDGTPVSDNLCTYAGDLLHGLPEPVRVEAVREHGQRRRHRSAMPHGRVEQAWEVREPAVRPSLVLVLRRGGAGVTTVDRATSDLAVRTLTAGTYAAGELRRYWAFSATLALGTGLGAAHPAIADRARDLCRQADCVVVVLGSQPGSSLADIVEAARTTASTPRLTQRRGHS